LMEWQDRGNDIKLFFDFTCAVTMRTIHFYISCPKPSPTIAVRAISFGLAFITQSGPCI
jgi:hypothetical protein